MDTYTVVWEIMTEADCPKDAANEVWKEYLGKGANLGGATILRVYDKGESTGGFGF